MKLKCSCKIFISQRVVPFYPQMLLLCTVKGTPFLYNKLFTQLRPSTYYNFFPATFFIILRTLLEIFQLSQTTLYLLLRTFSTSLFRPLLTLLTLHKVVCITYITFRYY